MEVDSSAHVGTYLSQCQLVPLPPLSLSRRGTRSTVLALWQSPAGYHIDSSPSRQQRSNKQQQQQQQQPITRRHVC